MTSYRRAIASVIRPVVQASVALAVVAGCAVSTNDEPVAVRDVFDRLVVPTSTTAPPVPGAQTRPALMYFLREVDGATELVPVRRQVDVGADIEEILSILFTTTPDTEDDASPDEDGLTTAFPDTATLVSATLERGTDRLVVDTSGLFGAQGVQSERLRNALAQIVFTATADPDVGEVLFQDEGERLSAIVGNNELVDDAVDRTDYRTLD
jgi:spore germination protein GerM